MLKGGGRNKRQWGGEGQVVRAAASNFSSSSSSSGVPCNLWGAVRAHRTRYSSGQDLLIPAGTLTALAAGACGAAAAL